MGAAAHRDSCRIDIGHVHGDVELPGTLPHAPVGWRQVLPDRCRREVARGQERRPDVDLDGLDTICARTAAQQQEILRC